MLDLGAADNRESRRLDLRPNPAYKRAYTRSTFRTRAGGSLSEPAQVIFMDMEYDVRLEQVGGRPLAVVRRLASSRELARVIPDACGMVWGIVRAQKLTGAGRHVALYWDDQINLEVGVELEDPFAGHGEVVGSATPAGAVATLTHLGPYSRLREAHQAVRRWCADHGYELAGPNWEIYGHWTDEWDADPAKIHTDVYYLLK
jgi:effector-binding domain-containing protein